MQYKNGIIPGRPLKPWQGYIKIDAVVAAKIDSLLPKEHFVDPKLNPKASRHNTPPVFIYKEVPDAEGYEIETYYSNPGNLRAMRGYAINRELFTLGINRISASSRGEVLNAFCEIEFLIDVMICLAKGVFTGATSYKKVKELYRYDTSLPDKLPDTQARLDYLLAEKMIRKRTHEYLSLAKKVRNTLAHQFMPGNSLGLSAKELKPYQDVDEAIKSIYNTAWFYLLQDYVPKQEVVIDWLIGRRAT